MNEKKILPVLITIFLAGSLLVGIIIVFHPTGKGKGESQEEEIRKGKFIDIFSGKLVQKEGISLVKIYGPIQTESAGGIFSYYAGGADLIVKKIKRARENRFVKALVLRVNSPGGTVAASQEILEEVKKTKQSGKKVVVSMGDLATSGGYYVSCHADRIFADQGTITGSIGVYVGGLNLTELGKKIGVDMNMVKSGKYKDILSPWRQMTQEERDLLQETVNDVYEKFVEEVSTGRGIPLEKVREIADGRILTGRQAKNLGLVDEMGGLQDAIEMAGKLAGLKGKPYIIKDYQEWWEDMFDMMEPPLGRGRKMEEMIRYINDVPVTYLNELFLLKGN